MPGFLPGLYEIGKVHCEFFRDFERSTILRQSFQWSLGRLVQDGQLMVGMALLTAVLFLFRKVIDVCSKCVT